MSIESFVSYKYVLDKLYRDLDFNEEINEVSVISWINEVLLKIGAFSQYEIVQDCLELTGGKAKLPCGFDKLVDINYKGFPVYWSSQSNASNYACHNCNIPICTNNICEYTFYINDSYIITNINNNLSSPQQDLTANVCINYLGMKVDEDGMPMIPNDVYFLEACAKYVTYMLSYQDWRRGRCTDKVYQEAKADYLWYVNAARGAANAPSLAQMENLRNVLQRLMPNTTAYKNGFRGFNSKERLNLR